MITQTKTTWQKVELGDIAFINPDSVGKDFTFEQILYSDISSVGTGIADAPIEISFSDAPSRARRLVKDGDTILSTVRPNRRSFLYLREPEENRVVSTGFAVLRAGDKIDSRFLYYLVSNQPFTDYLTLHAKGAAYPAVDEEIIAGANIVIPEIKTQKQIADVLSAYDDLIENNTKRSKILEQIAQAIYKEWFVYFRFPGHEKVKMIDSKTEFGKIPEGWEVKRLEENFEIVLGGTPSRANPDYWGGDIPWINSGEVNHLRIISPSELITKKGLDNSATKLMPKRTAVLAITGATLGQVSLLEIECSANQSVVGVYDKDALYSEYLYLFVSSQIEDIISKSGGSAQQHINKKIIEEYPILLPPEKDIENFNKTIRPPFDLLSDLLFANQNLRQARDLLLPKLVGGEIEVR
ncbi:MAG: restriction endonuclease subunit S [Candidatus Magasanikbacteria bacterium]|nr:restriction endonuclease subunit S [Candidatus Magasanikbacteria bacterium]